jgi:hypothetical protein
MVPGTDNSSSVTNTRGTSQMTVHNERRNVRHVDVEVDLPEDEGESDSEVIINCLLKMDDSDEPNVYRDLYKDW